MSAIGHARLLTRCGCSRVMEVPTPYPQHIAIPLLEDISAVLDKAGGAAHLDTLVPKRLFRLHRLEQHTIFHHEVALYREVMP